MMKWDSIKPKKKWGNRLMTQKELNRLNAIVSKIDSMSREERVEFMKKVDVRRKLIEAEMSGVEEKLEKTEQLLGPTYDCVDRYGKIMNATMIASAIVAGIYTLSLAGTSAEPGFVKLAYAGVGAATGAVMGLPVSAIVDCVDDARLNLKKYCLDKRYKSLENKKFDNNYIYYHLKAKEEMGE